MCFVVPALQFCYKKAPHGESGRQGIAGWEAQCRALSWATGYATSPEPEWEGAWTTSVRLWCPHWVIPKSHYWPSQRFPSWGTSLFPKARGTEMLVMVAGGRGEHSSPILIILAHPAVKRMQCVQGLRTFRCKKIPLKTPGSHIVERQRCLWLNGLGLSDRLILVGCWWFGFSLFLIWGPSWII